MMMKLNRTNTSTIGRWWWTVDKPILLMLLSLMMIGLLLVLLGSPSVAERIGKPPMYFFERQIFFVALSIIVMFFTSLLRSAQLLKLSLGGLVVCAALMVVVLVHGESVKGATRWINFPGGSIQPSEFMKPFLAVTLAWLFSERYRRPGFKGWSIGSFVFAVFATLLAMQPDIGMTVVICGLWGGMIFLSGLPYSWVAVMAVALMSLLALAYIFFPHVTDRINRFTSGNPEENYQVQKSLAAFKNGGLTGVGPGEGVVKRNLPDSHTDFIFSVAGEELGVISCFVIISIIAGVIVRGFLRVREEKDFFIMLAASGLLMLLGFQSMINIGVGLDMLPTKGMTLPLVSYGGSSTLAYAINAGMLLSLTRKRYGLT